MAGPDVHSRAYTSNVGLLSHDWKFDTSASLHIMDSKAQYTTYRAHYGTVNVEGNILLSIYGIEIVELQCLLLDNSISHVCLNDIMHIPKLQHSLFS